MEEQRADHPEVGRIQAVALALADGSRTYAAMPLYQTLAQIAVDALDAYDNRPVP